MVSCIASGKDSFALGPERQRKVRDSTCPAFQEKMSRRINLAIPLPDRRRF
jgi:hypothetical protein